MTILTFYVPVWGPIMCRPNACRHLTSNRCWTRGISTSIHFRPFPRKILSQTCKYTPKCLIASKPFLDKNPTQSSYFVVGWKTFFHGNEGSISPLTVWDSSKLYMRPNGTRNKQPEKGSSPEWVQLTHLCLQNFATLTTHLQKNKKSELLSRAHLYRTMLNKAPQKRFSLNNCTTNTKRSAVSFLLVRCKWLLCTSGGRDILLLLGGHILFFT